MTRDRDLVADAVSWRKPETRVKAELELSVSLLQATLESMADGVIAINCQGEILSFNQKFVQMWQIPETILISRNYHRYLTFCKKQLKDPENFDQHIQKLDSHSEIKGDEILELKDGKIFQFNYQPLRLAEQIVGRVCSIRDITNSKYAFPTKPVSTPPSSKTEKSLEPHSKFPSYPQIGQVFKFIEENYYQSISLSDVAVAVGYCPAYLTDLVRRCTGQTVNHWIIERRMVAARTLLLETNQCVHQIAQALGYQYDSHFFRQFRQFHETTPQAWRKAQRS
ncbi:MAG: helix-turn-helix domain-containing protein [Coleofasciculaceae cyanobacterium]